MFNISPTRMELTRLKKRLASAVKGHRLLKDKRDELMRQFLDMVRETKLLSEKVEKNILNAQKSFALASSVMGKASMASALMLPKQSVSLDIKTKSIMGVGVPKFEITQKLKNSEGNFSYGYAFTSGDLDRSISVLSDTLSDMLLLAEREKTIQLLADEIEKTRRRVNALEYVMIPDYRDTIKYISMKMDENERSNQARLMKVKDMMIKAQMEEKKTKE